MPLDPSYVGRCYPSSPPGQSYLVGREKIGEFARAIGATDPAHTDPDAARALGYPDVIAPPTFAIVLTLGASQQLMHDPELGLDFSRVVHGDQRFVHTRPITAGDRLLVTTYIDAIRSAAGNDLLTVRGEVTTEAGEHVSTAFCTLVARGTSEGAAR